MRRDLERLQDILEAIERILQKTNLGRSGFDDDPLVQVWVIHHLEIAGEACRGLSAAQRGRHPEVPWATIIGMRNILIHDYFGLNLDEVSGRGRTRRAAIPAAGAGDPRGRTLAGLRARAGWRGMDLFVAGDLCAPDADAGRPLHPVVALPHP